MVLLLLKSTTGVALHILGEVVDSPEEAPEPWWPETFVQHHQIRLFCEQGMLVHAHGHGYDSVLCSLIHWNRVPGELV